MAIYEALDGQDARSGHLDDHESGVLPALSSTAPACPQRLIEFDQIGEPVSASRSPIAARNLCRMRLAVVHDTPINLRSPSAEMPPLSEPLR